MSTKLKTKACGACGGSGSLPADDVGPLLQAEREAASISRSVLATAIGISVSYLRDLEYGHKKISNELLATYQREMEKLTSG